METAPALDEHLARATARFGETFGRAPELGALAPGRVNLLGEHVDYDGGLVLPLALELATIALAARTTGGRLRAHSTALPASVDLPAAPGALPAWGHYLHGVLAEWRAAGGPEPGGLELLVDSTVPPGGGLASSAALTVACATLLEAATGHSLAALDKARLCQRAEGVAGVPCGLMDPWIAIVAQQGSATLLDCSALTATPVPLPTDLALIVVDSGLRHALAGGVYAERRREVAAAATALGVPSLRALTPEAFAERSRALPAVLLRRARHVVTENERVRRLVAALRRRDGPAAGALLTQGHRSLRDDFEVSAPEIERLVAVAEALAAAGEGVHGARLTGGGFGGCLVVLTQASAAERAAAVLSACGAGGLPLPTWIVARPAAGTRVLDLSRARG